MSFRPSQEKVIDARLGELKDCIEREMLRERQLSQAEIEAQEKRVAELQEDRNRHKKFADVASMEYHKLSQEVTRLREALEDAGKHLAESRLSQALEAIDQALAGASDDEVIAIKSADVKGHIGDMGEIGPDDTYFTIKKKGAEDGRTTEARDNIPSGGDSHTGVCSTGSSPTGPTPLSEPLELGRVRMDMSDCLDGAEILPHIGEVIDENAATIEQRDAAIVAAIAEVRECNLVELYDYIKAVETRVGKLDAYREVDEPTIKLRLDKMQEQIRILDEGQRVSLIDVDDRFDKMQEQIEALERQVDYSDAERLSLEARHSSQLEADQERIEALEEAASWAFGAKDMKERLDALTEAVLMSLDHHKAVERGMKMWGSGDFERMANKLREKGESDG